MTVLFPLSLPSTPRRIMVMPVNVVSVSVSPFSLVQQVYEHEGEAWRATITTPRLKDEDAAKWQAFLTSLRGRRGTFLLGDDGRPTPRGLWSGTPVVDGASQSGRTLAVRGFTGNDSGVALAGDYLQVGTGSSARFYMNLTDQDADSNGDAVLDLWPALRESPSDGASIITTNPVGVFRLEDNANSWEWDLGRITQLTLQAGEAL